MLDTTILEVVKKKTKNFYLPVPLIDAYEELAKREVHGKEKWVVISAAILMLLESPEVAQNGYMKRIQTEDMAGGSFDALVASAKAASRRAKHRAKITLPDPNQLPPSAERGAKDKANSDGRNPSRS